MLMYSGGSILCKVPALGWEKVIVHHLVGAALMCEQLEASIFCSTALRTGALLLSCYYSDLRRQMPAICTSISLWDIVC